MTRYDFIALECLLKHAKKRSFMKGIINRFPELKGKSVEDVKWLIMTNRMLMTGESFETQRRKRLYRRAYGYRRYAERVS